MMLIVFSALLLGGVIGFFVGIPVPEILYPYVCILIFSLLLSIAGGLKAHFYGRFAARVFMVGFFIQCALSFGICFLGQALAVELYFAVLIYDIIRIFQNFSFLQRFFLNKWKKRDMI